MEAWNEEHVSLFLESRDLSEGSAYNYRWLLGHLDAFLRGKDFRAVSEDDVRRFMRSRSRLSVQSRNREKILLKSFFRGLYGYRRHTYPPCVDWIISTGSANNRLPVVNASDILKEEEVKRLVDATLSTRDRALWMVLWEGAPTNISHHK